MKTIQLITNRIYKTECQNLKISTYLSPCSLDEFDINIIDLSDKGLWVYNGNAANSINQIKNLSSIKEMVRRRCTSKVIYVLPQNIEYQYSFVRSDNKFTCSELLKDKLYFLSTILCEAVPRVFRTNNTHANPYFELLYENTYTEIRNHKYQSSFHFTGFTTPYYSITQSEKSNKHTTIYTNDHVYLTTLNVTSTEEDMLLFIDSLFPDDVESKPDWIESINFGDDDLQKRIISEKKQIISDAEIAISNAQNRLAENDNYKSILYTSGEELVRVVFAMLEQILNCSLGDFEDKKDEDFLIKKENVTFIGEIKGINSNVKNENITQVECHSQKYNDMLEENSYSENVKPILIISSFRKKNLTEREPINKKQIELAKRYGCLIVETLTLLRIFEAFLQNKISSEKCIEIFRDKTGLLKIDDII